MTLDKLDACTRSLSFGLVETLIDLRVLATDKYDVEVNDLTGTRYESLGASVKYSYRWPYRQLLKSADLAENRILQDEYTKYPNNVAMRLRSLSIRYHEEINPRLNSQSLRTTYYCSGVEIPKPLSSSSFKFYTQPKYAVELIDLIERYSTQCGAGLTY